MELDCHNGNDHVSLITHEDKDALKRGRVSSPLLTLITDAGDNEEEEVMRKTVALLPPLSLAGIQDA